MKNNYRNLSKYIIEGEDGEIINLENFPKEGCIIGKLRSGDVIHQVDDGLCQLQPIEQVNNNMFYLMYTAIRWDCSDNVKVYINHKEVTNNDNMIRSLRLTVHDLYFEFTDINSQGVEEVTLVTPNKYHGSLERFGTKISWQAYVPKLNIPNGDFLKYSLYKIAEPVILKPQEVSDGA